MLKRDCWFSIFGTSSALDEAVLKGWDSNEILRLFREAAKSVGLILIPVCSCSSLSFPVLSFYIV